MECPETVSEPASTPPADPMANLRAEAEKDLGALFGEAPREDKAPVSDAVKDDVEPKAPVAVDVKADEDKAPKNAPNSVQAPDLSWAPENLRPKLSSVDPEVLKALKDGWLRQSDYTKKTQSLAEERKALERAKEKAALWERLEANPAAALAAQRVLDGKSPVEPEATEDVDILAMDPKQLRAWVAKEAQAAAEKIAEERIRARVEAPVQRASELTTALNDYAADLGLSETNAAQAEAFRGAVAEAAQSARELGIEVSAANVVRFVKPYVEKALASTKTVTARDEGRGLAEVASPTSRTSSVTPSRTPSSVREGRAPKDDRERKNLALHILNDSFGVNATPDELERLLSK